MTIARTITTTKPIDPEIETAKRNAAGQPRRPRLGATIALHGELPLSAEIKVESTTEIKVEALAQAVQAGSIISFEVSANEPVQVVP